MTEINVAKGNTVYATANGVLLSKDKTSLLLFPKGINCGLNENRSPRSM